MKRNDRSEKNPAYQPHLLAALAIIYLVLRFGFTRQLDSLGAYSSYLFEIACVFCAGLLLGKKLFSGFSVSKVAALGSLCSLLAGFCIYKLAGPLHIQIPFDLKGRETICFLLIVAPLLEEAIFRFLLWQPVQQISKRPALALWLTSIAFAYSHFHAIWLVPAAVHPFILYQTAYTFALALGCGFFVYRYGSLASAMMIHFGFNLGFFLASVV